MPESTPEKTHSTLLNGCVLASGSEVTVRRGDLEHAVGKAKADSFKGLVHPKRKGQAAKELVFANRKELIEFLKANAPTASTPSK